MLVSRLPFVRLFQALLSLIAPEFFDKLAPCLEAGEGPTGEAGEASRPAATGQAPDTGRLHPQCAVRSTSGRPPSPGRR